MSAKNLDKHNRFRCITVGFRVSPEEQEEINRAVSLSGLTKQEYCYQKCMNRDIVVQPNPRVHKALRVQMENLANELKRFEHGKDVPPEIIAKTAIKLRAPLVGLSALMTTTVPAMEETIKLLREKAPWCKIVVGGAVLTKEYADKIGADKYAKDAMESVRYAEEIINGGKE